MEFYLKATDYTPEDLSIKRAALQEGLSKTYRPTERIEKKVKKKDRFEAPVLQYTIRRWMASFHHSLEEVLSMVEEGKLGLVQEKCSYQNKIVLYVYKIR